ncbi:MAG: AAA family ATPase [Thermodesulfobacteriota bacterium]
MQYYEILNLKSEPFSNSPDPEFFYGSREHAECLRKVEIAIRLRRGLNLVSGEVGTGKTTLCRQLLRVLAKDSDIVAHLVLDPSFSTSREFLTVLHRMLLGAEPPAGGSEFALKEAVKNALFRLGVEEGKIVVLIVDEGQKAGGEFLELLRELLNYETNEAKLLQIVIFAQNEFLPLLRERPNLEDRVNLSMELGPLDLGETREMIAYRLGKAASAYKAPRVFSEGALKAIHQATGGYPRKIIGLCHRVLLAMLMQNRTRADRALVRSVLEGGGQTAPRTNPVALGVVVVSMALALFLVVGAFMAPDTMPGRAYRYFSWWARDGVAEFFAGRSPSPDAPAAPAPEAPASRTPAGPVPAPSARLEKAQPEPTQHEPARPEPVKPEPIKPEPVKPEPIKPEPVKPEPVKPEPVKPEPVKPEPVKPEPVKSEPVRPQTAPEPTPAPAPAPIEVSQAGPLATPEPEAAQVLAPAGEVPAGSWEAALPPGCPTDLGRLRIVRGEILSDVISKIYGVYRVVHLRRIEAANPGQGDLNRVPAGSTVLLPAIPMDMPASARKGLWLLLGSFPTLQQAWDFLDSAPAEGPRARLVPWWAPDLGLRFAVVAHGPLRSAAEAEDIRGALPPGLAERADVVRLDAEGAVYFTDITGWKL